MDPQDTLSKSYTDSIFSYLYEQDNDVESLYNNNLNRHGTNQSISSNLSHFNSTGYTTPIIAIPKIMADDNNAARQTRGSSLYSSPRHYPNGDVRSLDQYSIDNESQDDDDDGAVTPLPKVQMLVISILLFSEPLTSTILFPFIYFMVSFTMCDCVRFNAVLTRCCSGDSTRSKTFICPMMKRKLALTQDG